MRSKGEVRIPWSVFTLLFISVGINYIDRGSLGVGAPQMGPELGLSKTQLGWLLSAFFWTYSGCLVLAGYLVDRLPVTRFYAAGFFLWSLATLATGASSGFLALFLLRMVLGIGESVGFPAYNRIIALGFDESRRGIANALIDMGTKVGPAIGTFVGGMLVASYGWRGMFYLVGVASLIWLVPWMLMAPKDLVSTPGGDYGPKMRQIVRRRAAWATFLGLFFFNYTWYFLVSWLPSYLVNERHLSVRAMAVVGALPFAATAIASLTTGWLTDRMIGGGASVSRVRRYTLILGLLLSGLTLHGATWPDEQTAVIFTVIAFIGIGIITSNLWAVTQTLAGPLAAGKWTGIQNGIGNLGGIVGPVVTGWSVQRTGSFQTAFLIASASLLLGAVMYGVVLRRVEPVKWV